MRLDDIETRNMSGVDYSKWDKMANEMSDSDDDNATDAPQVTTFDEPQSVTFGGTKASQAAEGWDDSASARPGSPAAPTDGSGLEPGAAAAVATGERGSGPETAAAAPVPKTVNQATDTQLAESGAVVRDDTSGRLSHVWRQTRGEVTVVVPAPPDTRAADVEVSSGVKPETVAEGVADLLRVAVKTRKGCEADGGGVLLLLEGELAFQAKLDGEGDVDWELKDFPGTSVARDSVPDDDTARLAAVENASHVDGGDCDDAANNGAALSREAEAASSAGGQTLKAAMRLRDRRGIEITLRKHCPIPGAAVWWKSLLKGGPEIDVSTIQGRAKNNHQAVWEEALGMFKERVAARKAKGKISVDMGDGV